MKTYSEFRPSAWDTTGLGLPDRQDWLVAPCSQNRDSDILTRANWEAMLETLRGATGVVEGDEEDQEDFEVHRFGHWGPGWFEIALVRPGSACAKECESIEGALENYPVLDEDRYSDMQCDEEYQAWEHYWATDFLKELTFHFDLDEDALDHVTHEQAWEAWHSVACNANWTTEWDYDGPRFNFSANVLSKVDVQALLALKPESEGAA